MESGKLIIFSAPSGAGKTTIVKHLLSKFSDKIAFSISASTREPRANEKDSVDYYFMSQEDFLHRIAKKEFVEFEEVYSGTFYGTLRSELDRIWASGKHVIFDIDVEGGLHLKRKFGDRALAVFVQPPSLAVLVERLCSRGTDSEAKLKERIAKADKELAYADKFDIILQNDNLRDARRNAEAILLDFIEDEKSE